ncbi:MAG TPA: response regulator [Polyangiaceae bacterium]|nr:response regulator [Polyangiaceae bacterium]
MTQLEVVARVAAGVAHDLNNVLTVVETYTGFVAEHPLDEDQRRDLEVAREAARRGATLTAHLLALSRPTTLETRSVDLNELVRGQGDVLRRVLRSSLTLVVQPAAAALPVRVDPTQIEQAILHLVLNARDATPDGGTISISLRNSVVGPGHPLSKRLAPGSYAVVAVRDTGAGMDSQMQRRIFEPYFTTKPGEASGLGLVIVQEVARTLRGAVHVESTPNRGSEFSIYLPLATLVPERVGAEVPSAAPVVLVVDDDAAVRAAIRRILSSRGYGVLEAADGSEAAQVASCHPGPIALVLSDLVMPGMGGRDAVERIRACKPEARVLFMSGYTLDRASDASAEAFVPKPFSPDELTHAVEKSLAGPLPSTVSPESPVVLLVDDEPALRSSLTRLLSECDVSTLTAKSSLHALQVLGEQHVDVVVSDQFMPGMDGVRLLETIRERFPRCARILFTAHPSSDIVLEAVNRGGVHKVLVKSMHPVAIRDEIARAAEDAFRARGGPAPTPSRRPRR